MSNKLFLFMLAFAIPTCIAVTFKHGKEYEYAYSSTLRLVDVDDFNISAKVLLNNIGQDDTGQEVRLRIESFNFYSEKARAQGEPTRGAKLDLSDWFSFRITEKGEVIRTYYHEDEDPDVLAFKNGIVNLLSGRFLDQREADRTDGYGNWFYETVENGHEGEHKAAYKVKATSAGRKYTKRRTHCTNVPAHAQSSSVKNVMIDELLGTIHSITSTEHVEVTHKTLPGFDPNKGMREVTPVSDFTDIDMPGMRAESSGQLVFVRVTDNKDLPQKPQDVEAKTFNYRSPYTDKSFRYERSESREDTSKLLEDVEENLNCIRNQPPTGSQKLLDCYNGLVKTMLTLPDEQVVSLVDRTFKRKGNRVVEDSIYKAVLLDCLFMMDTPLSQKLILNYSLEDHTSDPELFRRSLFHLVTMTSPPSEDILNFAVKIMETDVDILYKRYGTEDFHIMLLAFGSLSRKARDCSCGEAFATKFNEKVKNQLGLHDPYSSRLKRSSMTVEQALEYDWRKVVHLEALGNEGHESSFEHIVSHVNSTISPVVKRAGIHALRNYNHSKAADTILRTINDESAEVRHDAILAYQAHPAADLETSRRLKRSAVSDSQDMDPHSREKRGFRDGEFKWRLEAPGIDFRRIIGSKELGAAFGVVMLNYFDLRIAPLSGHFKIEIHDEVYARAIIGILGVTFDFFSARICFKGGAEYNLNILQEYDPRLNHETVKLLTEGIKEVATAIKTGIDLMNEIINEKFSLKLVIEDLTQAFNDLPKMVLGIKEAAVKAVQDFGDLVQENIPPFLQPMKELIDYVSKLMIDVKHDVTNFFYTLVQAIEITIPRAGELLFKSVKGIIEEFPNLFKDPKTSMARIGGGVVGIAFSIRQLQTVKERIINLAIINGEKPYWMEFSDIFEKLKSMTKTAFQTMLEGADEWIEEVKTSDDPLIVFTGGKMSQETIRTMVVNRVYDIIDRLFEPLENLQNIGNGFIDKFFRMYDLIIDVKEGFAKLKSGYKAGRALIDKVFGPKFDANFPKLIRGSDSCPQSGFYPSKNDPYEHAGVDLVAEEGSEIVAPLSGVVQRTQREGEARLIDISELPTGHEIFIQNIDLDETIGSPQDSLYVERHVPAGERIGTARSSRCINHIHVVLLFEGKVIDPSRLLAPRPPVQPAWSQYCNDKRVVLKGDTIVASPLVNGIAVTNTSESLPDDGERPQDLDSSQEPTVTGNEMYNALKTSQGDRKKRSFFKTAADLLDILVTQIEAFMENFQIRRIKLGPLVDFLHSFHLTESVEKLKETILTIKLAVDNAQCRAPSQMTDDFLQTQLINRGLPASGDRATNIEILTKPDNRCPFIAMAMKKYANMHCFYTNNCLEMQCCVSYEIVKLFQHTYKIFFRVDLDNYKLYLGLNHWRKDVSFAVDRYISSNEETFDTGIKLELLDSRLLCRYNLETSPTELTFTFGCGVCSEVDEDDCVSFIYLIENAKFPFPEVLPNGTIVVPDVDFESYFDKVRIKEQLDESAETLLEEYVAAIADKIREELGIPEGLLKDNPRCKIPGNMEDNELREELTKRELSVDGTREVLENRLVTADKSCTTKTGHTAHLPDIADEDLKKIFTYTISEECMRIDACLDVYLSFINETKTFTAAIELDPCNFKIHLEFENFQRSVWIIEYDWGKESFFRLTDEFYLRYNLSKNEDEFILTVALVGDFINFDSTFINSLHIPIPVCNENFTLPGAGDLSSFAESIGGKLSQEAFEVFTEAIGIHDILQNKEKCVLPPDPENCNIDVKNFIHPDLQQILRCKMQENCWGVSCCLEFDFVLPFSDSTINVSIPFVFSYNPCHYSVTLAIGIDYNVTRWLVDYEWDTVKTHIIGKGTASSIIIRYTIGKVDTGFIVDVQMDICLPLRGDEQYCVPQNTELHLLENEIIQTCLFSNSGTDDNEYPDFSLTDWLHERGREISDTVGEAGRDNIIEALNLQEFMTITSCDGTRLPYSPSVNGWANQCKMSHMLDFDLPEMVKCHVASDCKSVSCCVDIPQVGLSVQLSFEIDLCQNKIITGLEKNSDQVESALSDYRWGEIKTIEIGKVFRLSYKITKPATNMYTIDADFRACFERSGKCLIDTQLLKGFEIPKIFCRPTDKVDEILSNMTHQCSMDADLQGITCLSNTDIYPNMPETQTYIRIEPCRQRYIYSVDDKRWESSFSSVQMGLEYHQEVQEGLKLFYVIDESSTSYLINLGFEVCTDGEASCEKLEVLFAFPLYKTNCSAKARRKRRSTETEEYSDLQDILKESRRLKLSNKEINDILKDARLQEEILREEQFERFPIEDSDQDTTPLSLLKSLGKSNPMAMLYSNENTNWNYNIEVKGGQAILDILNDTIAAVGKGNQLFVPGDGLTEHGVRLLGKELANMTIGDLESFLEFNIANPKDIHEIIMDLKELAKALYAETTDRLFSGRLENAFDDFDVSIRGHFTFPLSADSLFPPLEIIIPLGPVWIIFDFGASYFLGIDVGVGLRVMSMVADANITPYAGIRVWGGASIGFVLYAEVRLTGYILDTRFPTYAELDFSRFPINLGLRMDLEMVPFQMTLNGLVTLRVKLLFVTIRKTIFRATLWRYVAPSVKANIIDNTRKEEDTSPPFVSSLTSTNEGLPSNTDSCLVYQVPNLDHTEPSFQIMVGAEDDKSQLKFFLDVGTYPGGTDTLQEFQLGGALSKLSMSLKNTGVPLYFTLHVQNSQGTRSTVSCYLQAYDVTIPTGRVTADFSSSSNPHFLGASIAVYDEYNQTQTEAAMGYGEDVYGDQLVAWHAVQLTEVENGPVDASNTETVIENFSGSIEGKLVGDVLQSRTNVARMLQCAEWCLTFKEHSCLSFNYDFGTSGICEILKAVEGHDHVLVKDGLFVHYERLYTGHAVEVRRNDLSLQHNHLYIINFHTVSSLGYSNIISSKGVLTDFYPPEPGFINNTKEDYLEKVPCEALIPDDRPDLRRYCIGTDHSFPNHRVIIDGPNSRTVFNGRDELVDQQYTRINKYISANWDGFHDNETSIRAYTWAVGREYCEDIVHPHNDPHSHFSSKSQWKNQGQIYPIPPPYTTLPDGPYYITVRALNGVEFGGPLALTVCHSTPYIVDTSPPLVNEIYNIRYDELSYFLYAEIDIGDPHSGISEYDVCLGKTSHDCEVLSWYRYDYHQQPKVSLRHQLPDGIPVWLRIRAVNNVQMSAVGVANQALLVDESGPFAGVVYDGSVYQTDLEFSKDDSQICANWKNFYDPESGISSFLLGVGTSFGQTDVIRLRQIGPAEHRACIPVSDTTPLVHGSKYYTTVYALNGGIVRRNTSATSNGVTIDLTPPILGQIVDGMSETFADMSFSSSETTVSSQWTPAMDPESGISDYLLKVENKRHGEETLLKDWVSVGPNVEKVVWRNFHLKHNDLVQTSLEAINGARNAVHSKTDGFLVDLTAPELKYIRDGDSFEIDKQYQSDSNRLSISFDIEDVESGLKTLKFQIHQKHNGNIRHIWPVDEYWYTETDTTMKVFHAEDLSLTSGAKYTFILAAENKAGITSTHESNGVTLDVSPPLVRWLHVGVFYGELEDVHEGYVYQADHDGIKISYLAFDPQSGITDIIIKVGTSKGLDDIKTATSYGSNERDVYVGDVQLTDTDQSTMKPVYYVTLQVKNGAGELSEETYSTPIVVVPEDVAGIVVDGIAQDDDIFKADIDYTNDDTTMEITFNGFKSTLHGIQKFVWAVGTSPSLEDIMPFTDIGLTFVENFDTTENSNVYSGMAHLPVMLEHGKLYFVTLRGITHSGHALQAVTDGIMIDKTPPAVTIDRVLDHDITGKDVQIYYEMGSDSLSGSWSYRDSEVISVDVVDNIGMVYTQIGTFPGGSDVQPVRYWLAPVTNIGEIYEVDITANGLPSFISVTVENKCGLRSTVVSPAVIVDRTVPEAGQIVCSKFIQPNVPIRCHWSGFFDPESPITKYTLYVGSSSGEDDILSSITVDPSMQEYTIDVASNTEGEHGDILHVTVVAINGVNKEITAYSEPVSIDTTPPEIGLVVALDNNPRVDNGVPSETTDCNTDAGCTNHSIICHHSFTSITVWWSPFIDEESGISSYYLAIGTTEHNTDVLEFEEIFNQTADGTHTVTGLNLYGIQKMYVKIMAVNGVGLSSVSTSNSIYLSYISQGLDPLSPIGIRDADPGVVGDIDVQSDLSTIAAKWDVTGEPCPVAKFEWSIERLDGTTIQEFRNTQGSEEDFNDQLTLRDGETYFSLLRVTNVDGYRYELHSDGVTIQSHPLVKGWVYDGGIAGYDLNILPSASTVSCHWNGFGDTSSIAQAGDESDGEELLDSQTISHYEVALGTDRRFPSTRTNIVPFKNVGKNVSHTFTDLDLVPGTARYYCTVKAYSTSLSTAQATSNGFYISYKGGVSVGSITVKKFTGSQTTLEFIWNNFTSPEGMMMYYVAVSTFNNLTMTDCKQYVDGGTASEERKAEVFDIKTVTNVGDNNFASLQNLQLQQGHAYHIFVMGIDQTGACNITSAVTVIDVTEPEKGSLTGGPYFNMRLSYTSENSMIGAKWSGYQDPTSGIKSFSVSLWQGLSCENDTVRIQISEDYTLPSYVQTFSFGNLNLLEKTPYFVKLVVKNGAGLMIADITEPVLLDTSVPVAGSVVEGTDFKEDVIWWGSTTEFKGTILHYQNPNGLSCPVQDLSFTDGSWTTLENARLSDTTGLGWNIIYKPEFISTTNQPGLLRIKMARDSKSANMLSGGYWRFADFANTSTYQFSIKAASEEVPTDNNVVTEILFTDDDLGSSFTTYNYQPGTDWTDEDCSCCFSENQTQSCGCSNCTAYLDNIRSTEIDRSDNLTENQTPACGFQIYSGPEPFGIMWCKFAEPTVSEMELKVNLPDDISERFINYKIDFYTAKDDGLLQLCLMVLVENSELGSLCGIPYLSASASCLVHVLNRDRFLPEREDELFTWAVYAEVESSIFPPKTEELCRYGEPFRGGDIPIVRYEAAIGSEPGLSDIYPFEEVNQPCIPCTDACSLYNCDAACKLENMTQLHLTLQHLDLQSFEKGNVSNLEVNYLTVKAVLGSGKYVTASSDGFYVDTTPPSFDNDAFFYFDVDQGEFTPVDYQGSNSTIKAVWLCEDEQSEITGYQWAIGSDPGLEDIQPFTSTGLNPLGINDDLEGILENNSTYYISVKCTNEAGLEATFSDSKGVAVVTEAPDPDAVGGSIVAAEDFEYDVYPSDARKTTDPTYVGASWEISSDSRVRRYEFCLGSSYDSPGDIFPCTWVGYNVSGEVTIEDGCLWLNGEKVYDLNELIANVSASSTEGAFTMEPGRVIFVSIRMCYETVKYSYKHLGTVTIVTVNTTESGVSDGTNSIKVTTTTQLNGSRKKRSVTEVDVEVITPSGLPEGETMLLISLTDDDFAKQYTSSASTEFSPYIVDPITTLNKTERTLVGRLQEIMVSFSVVSVGQIEMPGPLEISYSQTNPNPAPGESIYELIHWHPVDQEWKLTSLTCQFETDPVTQNTVNSTTTVKVCNTRLPGDDEDLYFKEETQFAVALILANVINNAPYLVSPTNLTFYEDQVEGYLYQLLGNDIDNDEIGFQLIHLESDGSNIVENIEISTNGTLDFQVCSHCFGTFSVLVQIFDIPTSSVIQGNSSDISLNITIEAVNDPPRIFLVDDQKENLLHDDVTEEVQIIRDNDVAKDTYFTAIVGAYDYDVGDILDIVSSVTSEGQFTVETFTSSYHSILNCDDVLCLGKVPERSPAENKWVFARVSYMKDTNFTGTDTIKLAVKDSSGTLSDIVTISVYNLEFPCVNGGICAANTDLECYSTSRLANFDDNYICVCTPTWTGKHCESDVNECDTHDCGVLKKCVNSPGSFSCEYSVGFYLVVGIVPLMFLIIIVAVVIYLKCSRKPEVSNNVHVHNGSDMELEEYEPPTEHLPTRAEISNNMTYKPRPSRQGGEVCRLPEAFINDAYVDDFGKMGGRPFSGVSQSGIDLGVVPERGHGGQMKRKRSTVSPHDVRNVLPTQSPVDNIRRQDGN